MKTHMNTSTGVRTAVRLSLRWKILIGSGIVTIVAGVIVFLIYHLGSPLPSVADPITNEGPESGNVYFNSSPDSYIEFGRGTELQCINSLPLRNRLTITLWVQWHDIDGPGVGPHSTLFSLNDSTGSGDNGVFWIQHNSDNSRFEFALRTADNGRVVLQSLTSPTEGSWYHLACVYNGVSNERKMQIYVNGMLEGTLTNISGKIAEISPSAKMNMGRCCNPQDNYRHFNGFIDEASIWSTALTETEIIDLMGDPTTVLGANNDAPGLLGYWNFDNQTAASSGTCSNTGIIGVGATLPVDLVTFEGTRSGKYALLKWVTATETNNHYFSIERSNDMRSFESIGIVNGSGNSNSHIYYSFTDEEPVTGTNYYRLRQVDYDGSDKCSQIIVVAMGEPSGGVGELKIGPNPFTDFLNVKFTADHPGNAYMQLYDLTGKLVQNTPTLVNEGSNDIRIDIDDRLPPGSYVACISQDQQLSSKVKLNLIR